MVTNIPEKDIDSSTLRKFNNSASFTDPVKISGNKNDIILQFFLKFTDNHQAARALTSDFIKQAVINNYDPVDLVQELEGLTGMQLNNTLAALFNAGREKTSLIGFRANRVALDHISRTVIA